ncbi:hypothetical protein ACE38V_05415 [Cytobacillus sp. Hz8]|uniref:hypothetical protein n=1 Tax=Cytobacillus sp. Hz8 TaxID=3347168 RepID=UPI0035E0C223
MKKGSVFILFLILLAGCNQNVDGLYEQDEDQHARAFVNNNQSLDSGTGGTGVTMSDQNPNLVPVDKERSQRNQKSDVDQARKAILTTKEFKPGSVWINAGEMTVTAYKNGYLTNSEERAAERRLHHVLVHALPRYDINVHVEGTEK